MWAKVLKLEEILPKQLITRNRKQNTELSYAIVLTKTGNFEKAEIYAKRAVQALERELKINKTINIQENICPSKEPRDIARFRLKMQSLCLAYHHLATIKRQLGHHIKAVQLFELSRAVSSKFVKDKKLLKIIEQDAEKVLKKASPLFSNKRKNSLAESEKIIPKWKKLDEKELLAEIFGRNKQKKTGKEINNANSTSALRSNLIDSLPLISMNIMENSFSSSFSIMNLQPRGSQGHLRSEDKRPTKKTDLDNESQNKLRIVNDITYLRKLEIKAAITIQKHYKGYLARKKAKNIIKDYVIKILPGEYSSDSSESWRKAPKISFNPYDSFLDIANRAANIYDLSEKWPSQNIEENDILKELEEEYHEDSDLEILIPVKPAKFDPARRLKPTLFDFLNLTHPDLYISQNMNHKIYTWRIGLDNIRVKSGSIFYKFQICGDFDRFTDILYYSRVVHFNTIKCDTNFLSPFEFDTAWPIIETELMKCQTKFDRYEDINFSDEGSIEVIKDIVKFTLLRCKVIYRLNGFKLSFIPVGAIKEFSPSLIGSEDNLYANVVLGVGLREDFQQNKFLSCKDGVVKAMIEHAAHEEKSPLGSKEFIEGVEEKSVGCILERGIVYMENCYFMLKLSVVKAGTKKTAYKTALSLELVAMQSNWFNDFILFWEQVQTFYHNFSYNFDVYYTFCTNRLQTQARNLLFDNFSEYFCIENSKIAMKFPQFIDLVDESNIFLNSKAQKSECHEEWDGNFDSFASINHSQDVQNLVYGIVPCMKIQGESDYIHLKFTGINRCIQIQGKIRMKNEILCSLVTDFYKVNRILKVFEMGEIVKSILENEICIRKTYCGKVLSYDIYTTQKAHSAIRLIEGSRYFVSVVVRKNIVISLYNLSGSWDVETCFTRLDLKKYFPSLDIVEDTAIYYERSFFGPLVENFQLARGLFGAFSCWKIAQASESASNSSSSICSFQFTAVKSCKQQDIITIKPLFERKIANVLKENPACLMESVYQEQIILQRSRLICGLFALVTITKMILLEEWRIYLHFFQNSREFVCKLYDSDMFGLEENAFDKKYNERKHVVNKAKAESKLWEIILAECKFEHHLSLDFVFRFDNITSPMRELLYSSHIKYSKHVYYEVFMKCSIPFNSKFSAILNIKDTESIILTLRTYNFMRKLWEKCSLRLKDGILVLMTSGVVNENILLNTCINYSHLKIYAGVLCRIVKMHNKENTVPMKLFPTLEFSEAEEQDLFEEKNSSAHSVSSIFEKDTLLYQCVDRLNPVFIISVHYNEIADEFSFKVYKPEGGDLYRVPLSKKQVFRKIPFSKTLLKEKAYLALGKKIFIELKNKILKVVNE